MNQNNELSLSCYSRLGKNIPNKNNDSLKIYFSYVPEDANAIIYFKEIVLKLFNEATIYYLDYEKFPDANSCDIKSLLKEMTVAIFFITLNYFKSVNDNSCSNELKLFKCNNLPVLPIVQYQSIIDDYSKTFGTLHFVGWDENNGPKRLERSLNKIFETYGISTSRYEESDKYFKFKKNVFFSYRRLDKEYVRKAIDEIHYSEKNQDIAIWFDDFLVPGLEFDNSIDKKLQSVDLCLFLITPKVLTKDNYVIKEYQIAKKLNKTVIPVKGEEVKQEELEEALPGIGKPLTIIEVAKYLEDFYSEDKYSTLDNDDLFALGCSYIFGNTVERNPIIGLKLIEKAAINNNYYRFYLAELYRQGPRIEINYKEFLNNALLLIYKKLNYDYQQINQDDELFFKLALNTVKTFIEINGLNKEARELIRYIDDIFNNFNFNDSADGYYVYLDSFLIWYLNYGYEIGAMSLREAFKLADKLFNRDDSKYAETFLEVTSEFLNAVCYLFPANFLFVHLLSTCVGIAERLIENDPFYVFKSHSWFQLPNIMQEYRTFDPIEFLDRVLKVVNVNKEYDSKFEIIERLIFISKVGFYNQINRTMFMNHKERFLNNYQIKPQAFQGLNNIFIIKYYTDVTNILYDYQEYDLALKISKEFLSYLSAVEQKLNNHQYHSCIIRCLGGLVDINNQREDYQSAKEYLEQFNDLLKEEDVYQAAVIKRNNNIYSAMLNIYLSDGENNKAEALIKEIKEYNEKEYDWLGCYLKVLIKYATTIDNEKYLLNQIQVLENHLDQKELDEETAQKIYTIIANVLSPVDKFDNLRCQEVKRLNDFLNKIIDLNLSCSLKRDCLSLLGVTLIKHPDLLGDGYYEYQINCYYLYNRFFLQNPQRIDEALLSNYNLLFLAICERIYKSEKGALKGLLIDTCTTCHNIWPVNQNAPYFNCYIIAYSILINDLGVYDVINKYVDDIIDIKEQAAISYQFFFAEGRVSLSGFYYFSLINVLLYDLACYRAPEMINRDLVAIVQGFLSEGTNKQLQSLLTELVMRAKENNNISPGVRDIIGCFLRMSILVNIVVDSKQRVSDDVFLDLSSMPNTNVLLGAFIDYLDKENVEEYLTIPFIRALLKGISSFVVNTKYEPTEEECVSLIMMFSQYSRRLFEKSRKNMSEEEKEETIKQGIIFYGFYLKKYPSNLTLVSYYVEQVALLLETDLAYHHYAKCLEDYHDYYLFIPNRDISTSRFHFACLCLYGAALSLINADTSLIVDTYKQAFKSWKVLLRMGIEIEESYYIKDTLECLMFDDKNDTDNLYSSIYLVLFGENETREEKINDFQYVSHLFFEYSEFEVAIYFDTRLLKYLENNNINNSSIIKNTYQHLAQAYEFAGMPEKAEHYYILMNTLED